MLPGLASLGVRLLHALAHRHDQIDALESMVASGLRLGPASRSPVDFLRADRLSSDAIGIHAAVADLLRIQERIASATEGIDRALDRLAEMDALLVGPVPAGSDRSTEIDQLLARFDGAIRAAGSSFGDRLLSGGRVIRFSGGHALRAGDIRVLRAPHDPVELDIEIDAMASAPTMMLGVPPGAIGQALEMKIDGPFGSATISLSAASIGTLANAIEDVASITGVHAIAGPGAVQLTTPVTGSTAFITLTPISGAAISIVGPTGATAAGTDASAHCMSGDVEARGNLLRVVRNGALVEVDVRAIGNLKITTGDGGLLVRRSIHPDASFDARLGLPALLSDQIGFEGIGRLSAIRSDGALAAATTDPVIVRAVIRASRDTLERVRSAMAGFESTIVERDRLALEAMLETLDAANAHLRMADLPWIAEELANQRRSGAMAQEALESLFAQTSRLLTLIPSSRSGT